MGDEERLVTPEDLLELYGRMRLIRQFEERAGELYKATEIPGFLHLSIGQEAVAVGTCWPLTDKDVITSTHRGHGHCLAKGLDPVPMMAELMGRATGTCAGRGGSMHIADPLHGVFGANGIVGAGLPIAVGAATASTLRQDSGVAVAFFGDGAVGQGTFHEAVNLATAWQLPVLFVCENNHFAEFTRTDTSNQPSLRTRASGYGIGYRHVDGNDVIAVVEIVTEILDELRAGSGPIFLEAETYRIHGHYEGDPEVYRDKNEVGSWRERDPIQTLRKRLVLDGVAPDKLEAIDLATREKIEYAVESARAAPYPDLESLGDFVYQARPTEPIANWNGESNETFKMMHAVRNAIEFEMSHDSSVFVAGIDVAAGGNVFGLFRGLSDAFPGRVRDTPISESAIIGAGIGAAMAGMKPIVEIMYMDFLGVCFDQLLNQASKLPFMTGGRASVPLVVRTQFAAGRSSGAQHSQSLEALLAHIPGLTVVMPSNPAETYGLLRAAIRDPNPVVFVENRLSYGMKGPKPPDDYMIPLGKARVVRPGADVTLVSYSRMVGVCIEVATALASDGIDVEVIDLRTIMPWDRETVLGSLAKTNRLVIAHEATKSFGVGAEIAATAADEGFWTLDAPVIRVGAVAMPAPYSPPLEAAWLPSVESIAAAVRRAAAA